MAAQTVGMTAQEKAAFQRSRDKKTGRQRQKAVRKNLGPIFIASLTGQSAQNRLQQLCPAVVGKGQKAGGKTAQNRKNVARKTAKNKKKKASATKKQHKMLKKLKKQHRMLKWQRLNPEAASMLGNPDGPMQGKQVRLIGPGLSEFQRNSPATVLSHFTVTDTVTVKNHGGSVNTYPASHLYILTGTEKLPMQEKAELRKVRKTVKTDALTAAGGQLKMEK